MLSINLKELKPAVAQNYLQHAIAPRPIAFASTISAKGEVNLSPFSFFNLFSSNPPIVIFSPARRVRNNTIKHTLENVMEVPEVVINIADYAMVQQLSLASCEYADGVNEFIKAGFAMQEPTVVKPPMVKESKIKMECKVLEIKPLGTEGGAGNLVICEVMVMHIDRSILNENNFIDQTKIEHIARLGGDWYCRANKQSLFMVPKPNTELGMGIDELPLHIKHSSVLTGNHLGMLANVTELPELNAAFEDEELTKIMHYYSLNPADLQLEIHKHAARLLDENKVQEAWQVLLTA